MKLFLNDEKMYLDINNKHKEEILAEVRDNLSEEIIDEIYLDDVEVSLDYFEQNNIELNKLDKIKFITKKNEVLIEETVLQAKEYLPKLKNALIQTSKLYETKRLNDAANKLEQSLDGIEWYIEAMTGIFNLIDEEDISVEGKELLDKLNKANSKALMALQNDNYDYLSDIIKVEVVEYLQNLDNLNNKLLKE